MQTRNTEGRLTRISVPGAMYLSDSTRHPDAEMSRRVAGPGQVADSTGMDRRAASFFRYRPWLRLFVSGIQVVSLGMKHHDLNHGPSAGRMTMDV